MNAIAIFLLLTISVIGLSATLITEFIRSTHRNQSTAPDLAPQEQGKPELRLGDFTRIGTTNVLRAELREMGEGSFSIKGSRSVAHNVLFIDTNEGKSWWLLPDSNSTIEEEHEISISQNGVDVSFGKVYLVESGDQGLEKQSSILLADSNGSKQVILAKGKILIDELTTFSANEAKLLFHDSAEYHLVTLSPSETKAVKDTAVKIAFPLRK